MSKPITADELEAVVALQAGHKEIDVRLPPAHWDHIIAALRRGENRLDVRWRQNCAYVGHHLAGSIWPIADETGRWGYYHGRIGHVAPSEADARAAVERAVRGGL